MQNNNMDFYEKLYAITERMVPMLFDCGLLCSNACCRGSKGMLLFPGEEEYLESTGHGFSIVDTDICHGGDKVRLLNCGGKCRRSIRPLACRFFPLFPFLRNGRITVGFDPRAAGICPLLFKDIDGIYISGLFRLRVLEAGHLLSRNEDTSGFLSMLSRELDEIARFRL